MNVGTARYWLCEETPRGPVLVGLFASNPPAGQLTQFVIDRGPINLWTGLPQNDERPPKEAVENASGRNRTSGASLFRTPLYR